MRRFWGDLIKVFQYLEGSTKKDRKEQFTRAWNDRKRENGLILSEIKFRLDIRKKILL